MSLQKYELLQKIISRGPPGKGLKLKFDFGSGLKLRV